QPQLPELLASCERLAGELGLERVGELLSLFRAIEADILDDDVRLRVQRTIARYAERQGDLEVAADFFKRVLEHNPSDLDTLAAMEGIYRRIENDEALYDINVRRAEIFSGKAGVELPQRLQAGALAARLGRRDEAVAAFERAWTLQPGHPEALAAL